MSVRLSALAASALLLLGMLSLQAQAAANRPLNTGPSLERAVSTGLPGDELQGESSSSSASAWWSAFEEQPLNRLLAAAEQRGVDSGGTANNAATSSALTGRYLMLRVLNLRLRNLRDFQAAVAQEREWMAAQPPRRELAASLSAIDQRALAAEALAHRYARELASTRQSVLRLAGDSAAAREALADAETLDHLPWYPRAVPVRLPASVLGSRSDIAYLARYTPSRGQLPSLLTGWIEASGTPPPLQLDSPGDAELPLGDVVRQAAHEVSWSLARLMQAATDWDSQARLMEAARLEFVALQRRAQAGEADSAALSNGLQKVFQQADAVAEAHARLALAWVELLARAPSAAHSLRMLRAQAPE